MKNKFQSTIRFILLAILTLAVFAPVFAQNKWNLQDDGCGAVRWYGSPSGAFNLEIKEQTIAAPPKEISIDGGKNGGVRIVGWNRNEMLVRACVQSFGVDENQARRRTAAIKIKTKDGFIRAATEADEDYSYGVNYDIRVPVNTDLAIKTINGGINLSNVRGDIEFDLTNGGAILNRVAGSIRGKTVNGSLTLTLDGSGWDGAGLDIRTTNGDVLIFVPENYSAKFEAATRRGNFYTDIPESEVGADKYQLNLTLGAGGATIKTATTNGKVSIKRQPMREAKTND